MNKQVLDREQMQHLQELGLDTSNASMVLIYTDCNCDVIEWDDVQYELSHPDPMEMFKTLHDAETGNYDHSYRKYCGVFTLQDIIDLLPSNIDGCYIEIGKQGVSYIDYESARTVVLKRRRYLIDAVYEMLCWCIENGYVKTNKED